MSFTVKFANFTLETIRLVSVVMYVKDSLAVFSHSPCCVLMQGEPSFNLFGFLMCIGATAARALKSVLQGILLSSEG